MHLTIDSVGNKSGGGAIVLLNLLDSACRNPKVNKITVFASPVGLCDFSLPVHPKINVIYVASAESDLGRTYWAVAGLQRRIKELKCDIFLGMNGIGYDGPAALLRALGMSFRPQSCPVVTFIQQPIPFSKESMSRLPATRRFRMGVIFWAMKRAGREADHIFVQTKAMRRDVSNAFRVAAERINYFLPDAPALPTTKHRSPKLERMRRQGNRPRLLYVGSGEPHKNLGVVDQGLRLMREASRPSWFVTLPAEASVCRSGCALPLGNLNREELAEAYSLADVLVMPSLTESVGLPMLEALRLGKPVLAADRPFAHEVCETAAQFFDPLLPEDFVAKLTQILEGEGVRTRLEVAAKSLISDRDRASAYDSMVTKLLDISDAHTLKAGGKTPHSVREVHPAGRKERRICTNCIMDESDPGISFDANGRCHHCGNFYENILPNWHTEKKGEEELGPIVDRIKRDGRGRDHDCLIGISGGLDSSYLTYVAKEKLGLRPMIFHVDAGWNNRLAVSNIERLIEGLKLDLYTEVIDWEEMRDLQLAFLKSQVADQDIPQDLAFFSALYNYAEKNGHRYILTGGNYSTECVREPLEWGGYYATDMRFVRDVHRRFGEHPLSQFPTADIFKYKIYYRYFRGVRMLKILNNVPYVKADAERTLGNALGWEPFQHKHHESRFTRFYEDYWLPRKFGFEKRRAHFSSLILTGQMTREDALRRIARPELDEDTSRQEFAYVAKKLGLEVPELQALFDAPNRTFWDYNNNMRLISLGTRLMRVAGLEHRRFGSGKPKR